MWKSQQPMIVIFHNFPPTGFKKLPHTIFKMAAQACRGGADSVIHSLDYDYSSNFNICIYYPLTTKKDVSVLLLVNKFIGKPSRHSKPTSQQASK